MTELDNAHLSAFMGFAMYATRVLFMSDDDRWPLDTILGWVAAVAALWWLWRFLVSPA